MNRVVKKGERWTPVPNEILRDGSLSGNARILWVILWSFSEEFQFKTEHVRSLLGVGRDAYRNAWNELEAKGIATRVKSKLPNGHWSWDIELDPSGGIPDTGYPSMAEAGIKEYQVQENQLQENHHHQGSHSLPSHKHQEDVRVDKTSAREKKALTKTDEMTKTLKSGQTFGLNLESREAIPEPQRMDIDEFEQRSTQKLGINLATPRLKALLVTRFFDKQKIIDAFDKTATSATTPGWAYFRTVLESDDENPQGRGPRQKMTDLERDKARQYKTYKESGIPLKPEQEELVQRLMSEVNAK